ncbi:DUF6475 domain-containing protein [Chitinimonas sp. PSY-7]|uniref:DUF6475 domain-containing protein n=1 Tax=Chitinimonas sp. PSY-7 TaxID=3459088 RepID=UPI0040401FFC
MRNDEESVFSALLSDVLGFYGKSVSDFTLDVWCAAMEPFDLAAVRMALNRHCVDPDRGQFPPKPADIVRMLQGGGSKDSAALAWAQVDKALRSVGTYPSVVFDDPIIHACITDLGGWTALGQISNDEWPFLGHRFVTLYQGYRLRDALPPYPPVLTGIAESENSQRGMQSDRPMLIGDPVKAQRVMSGGSARAGLRLTRAPSDAGGLRLAYSRESGPRPVSFAATVEQAVEV